MSSGMLRGLPNLIYVGERVAPAAEQEPLEPVAPKGDRLIIFEADALAHGVEAYRDAAYWRYALTVWILASDDVLDLDAARREEWRPLSPTATHSSMVDADRASS